jgi:hypothetical protein
MIADCLENQFTHYDDHEHWVETKAQALHEVIRNNPLKETDHVIYRN